MTPSKDVRLKLGTLLAADAGSLAPAANGNKIALVKSNFVATENLAIADVTLADFDGSTPIVLPIGTQDEGLDPLTGDQIVQMKEPAGGLRFETTGITNLPQTIYGFVLMNNAGTVLLASERFPTPIVLSLANQFINIPGASLRFVATPIS